MHRILSNFTQLYWLIWQINLKYWISRQSSCSKEWIIWLSHSFFPWDMWTSQLTFTWGTVRVFYYSVTSLCSPLKACEFKHVSQASHTFSSSDKLRFLNNHRHFFLRYRVNLFSRFSIYTETNKLATTSICTQISVDFYYRSFVSQIAFFDCQVEIICWHWESIPTLTKIW